MHDEVYFPQGTQSSSAGGICPGMKSTGTQAGRGLKDCRQLKSTLVLVAALVAAPASGSGTVSPRNIKIVSSYRRNLTSSLCCVRPPCPAWRHSPRNWASMHTCRGGSPGVSHWPYHVYRQTGILIASSRFTTLACLLTCKLKGSICPTSSSGTNVSRNLYIPEVTRKRSLMASSRL